MDSFWLADRLLILCCSHLSWNNGFRERSIEPINLRGKQRLEIKVNGWLRRCPSVAWFCTWTGFICVLQVLCSNSVLDSSEYWLRNEKGLCRLGLLDDDTEAGCTMVSSILQMMKHAHPFGNKDGPTLAQTPEAAWCMFVKWQREFFRQKWSLLFRSHPETLFYRKDCGDKDSENVIWGRLLVLVGWQLFTLKVRCDSYCVETTCWQNRYIY